MTNLKGAVTGVLSPESSEERVSAAPEPIKPQETHMEIHKPKPVHSWREFLKEYAIIVLGVATALAAEQAVEWLHWRAVVADAQTVVTRELAENLAQAVYRVRNVDCTEKRLDALAVILDKAAESGRLPPVGIFGTVSSDIWPNAAWNTVMTSQAASHFAPERIAMLSRVYRLVDAAQEARRGELEAWMDIYPIAGPGRKLDPASEAALRAALSRVRSYDRVIASASLRLTQQISELELSFAVDSLRLIQSAQHQDFLECGAPGGNIPPHYGQGILNSILPMLEKARNAPLKLKQEGA